MASRHTDQLSCCQRARQRAHGLVGTTYEAMKEAPTDWTSEGSDCLEGRGLTTWLVYWSRHNSTLRTCHEDLQGAKAEG